jgi:hypothetical protein
MPRALEIAIREALGKCGVSVLVRRRCRAAAAADAPAA